jgi:histone H3/H4
MLLCCVVLKAVSLNFVASKNVQICKKVLPENTQLSPESKLLLQASVAEFLGFVTSEACDQVASAGRKKVTGDDYMRAMRTLGMTEYASILEQYLAKYNDVSSVSEKQIMCSFDSIF